MAVLYNNRLLSEEEFQVPVTDRAFQYNDGFFETIMVVNGKLRFWPSHLQRMQEAAKALHLKLPGYFSGDAFERQLLALAKSEPAATYGRLKLKVWRAGKGLYTPETNAVNWLATVASAAPTPSTSMEIGICRAVHTSPHTLSAFKGPNAPLYILAGLEKKAVQMHDMLLLSPQGFVSELISSNIFWLKDRQLFTPSIKTGCVNGIVRRAISEWCKANAVILTEVEIAPESLVQADAVFATNVTGIRSIKSIAGQYLSEQPNFINQIRQSLFT